MKRASEAADAGIVHENVEPSEALFDLRGDGFDRAQVHDVAFQTSARPPAFEMRERLSQRGSACARKE